MRSAALCNDSTLRNNEDHWDAVGDPTEVALIVAAAKFGINEEYLREKWPRLDELPFDSAKKIMVTLHQSPLNQKIIYLKGAPESVIPILKNPETSSGDIALEYLRAESLQLAKTGMRVLAFACRKLPR